MFVLFVVFIDWMVPFATHIDPCVIDSPELRALRSANGSFLLADLLLDRLGDFFFGECLVSDGKWSAHKQR